MRLKTSIFVAALLRREQAEGAFAAVLRKGAEEAGALFVVHLKSKGADVYAPAPQYLIEEANPSERYFELRLADVDGAEVSDYLERQVAFDQDCWIVEIEKNKPLDTLNITDAP